MRNVIWQKELPNEMVYIACVSDFADGLRIRLAKSLRQRQSSQTGRILTSSSEVTGLRFRPIHCLVMKRNTFTSISTKEPTNTKFGLTLTGHF